MSALNGSNANSCSMCRALGVSACKGHGGSVSVDEEQDKVQSDAFKSGSASKQFLEVAPVIGRDWKLVANNICVFDNFNKNAAIARIELNPKDNAITFLSKENLQASAVADVYVLFTYIKEQAEKKGGVGSISGGALCIDASKTPNKFSDLLANLMVQNILPAKASDVNAQAIGQKAQQAPTQAQAYASSVVNWPPTPPGFSHTSHDEE